MDTLLNSLKELVEKLGLKNILKATTAVLVLVALLQTGRIAGVFFGEYSLSSSLENVSAASPQRNSEKKFEDFDGIFTNGAFGKGKSPAPPTKLFGVLGNQALMGSSEGDVKAYDVGAEIPGGAKIIRIEPNQVTLEKDGEESTLSVFPDFGKPPKKKNTPKTKPTKSDAPTTNENEEEPVKPAGPEQLARGELTL